jgi:hypothetical protein
MALPWRTVAEAETPDGKLVLRRRGTHDILLTIDGRVLMSSMAHRSEVELVRRAAERMHVKERPQVLIAGLGLGFSLEAALQALPVRARIAVCELNPDIVHWARGPIADLVAPLLDDPRVTVIVDDVSRVIANAATAGDRDRFDAIILDLYTGPNEDLYGKKSPIFGAKALARTRDALMPGGIFAVWSEEVDEVFEKRLRSIGFDMDRERSKGKGPRHVIYLATPSSARQRMERAGADGRSPEALGQGPGSGPRREPGPTSGGTSAPARRRSGPKVAFGSRRNTEPKTGARPGRKAGPKSGRKAGAKAGPKAGAKSGPKAGARAGRKAGANAGPKSGREAGPKSGASAGAKSGAGSTPRSEEGPKPRTRTRP